MCGRSLDAVKDGPVTREKHDVENWETRKPQRGNRKRLGRESRGLTEMRCGVAGEDKVKSSLNTSVLSLSPDKRYARISSCARSIL